MTTGISSSSTKQITHSNFKTRTQFKRTSHQLTILWGIHIIRHQIRFCREMLDLRKDRRLASKERFLSKAMMAPSWPLIAPTKSYKSRLHRRYMDRCNRSIIGALICQIRDDLIIKEHPQVIIQVPKTKRYQPKVESMMYKKVLSTWISSYSLTLSMSWFKTNTCVISLRIKRSKTEKIMLIMSYLGKRGRLKTL